MWFGCLAAALEQVKVRAAARNGTARPTRGAYGALFTFADGAFASLSYSGYGHFDSDEWMGWSGELGVLKSATDYGVARRRLSQCGRRWTKIAAKGTKLRWQRLAASQGSPYPSALRAGAGERRTGRPAVDGGGVWVMATTTAGLRRSGPPFHAAK